MNTRRDFLLDTLAAGAASFAGCVVVGGGNGGSVKFLLMSDTHVESDFLEHGRPVYTCWKPGNHLALEETYRFINEDEFCRDVRFALFCGDQINTGYSSQQSMLDEEMAIYRRTLMALDLHRRSLHADMSDFKFRTHDYVCTENVLRGREFHVSPPPLSSRVIAIQGNHDTGCPEFYRDASFQCGNVRFITFFAQYVGLPAPKGQYRSTAKISDETLAFVERELAAAAGDSQIRHIVLACHWSIVTDDTKNFRWPIMDECRENGYSDNRRKLLALAEKYGCRLYINGHEHSGSWYAGKVGNITDVNCGTMTAEKSPAAFAIVEIDDLQARFHIYSRAVAEEINGKVTIVSRPRRLFTRMVEL